MTKTAGSIIWLLAAMPIAAAEPVARMAAVENPAPTGIPATVHPKSSPIALGADRKPLRVSSPERGLAQPWGGGPSLATSLVSLGFVLGLFLLVAWMLRRSMPSGARLLPGEVVEVLGRVPLAGRQQAHLVRLGNKLILVALSPGCAETLTEITDPLEVDRLAGLCRQNHPQSVSSSFREVFEQLGKKKTRGFLGTTGQASPGSTGLGDQRGGAI